MQYNTQRFTSQIRSIIERGETGQALEMLVYSLPEYNPFRNDFVSLLGEYEELKHHELLGIANDPDRRQRIRYATVEFLQNLERHHYPTIELANAPLSTSTRPKRKASSTHTKKRRTAQPQKTVPAQSIKKNVETHVVRFVLYGLAFVAVAALFYSQCLQPKQYTVQPSQSFLADNSDVKHIGLFILLNQFERFEDADAERKQYKKRPISILHLNGDTKPFKTVIISDRNLDKILYDVQTTWPQAALSDYSSTCPTFRYEKSVAVYICAK